jgi:hypothetical protein
VYGVQVADNDTVYDARTFGFGVSRLHVRKQQRRATVTKLPLELLYYVNPRRAGSWQTVRWPTCTTSSGLIP